MATDLCSVLPVDSVSALSGLLQVPIPEPLRSGMVALAFSDFALTYGLEHMLRAAFPASTPPKKGYQAILNKKSNRQRHLNHSAKKQH